MECRPRVVDRELRGALTAAGAVVIEGPKACGRTATARQMAASELRVDTDPRVPHAIAVDPLLFSVDAETQEVLRAVVKPRS
ncbi:MAG: hypothetical protein HHJ14_05490 [Cellulomonas sp.]|nr:hypothetical protein [Cellulomonas sp.]